MRRRKITFHQILKLDKNKNRYRLQQQQLANEKRKKNILLFGDGNGEQERIWCREEKFLGCTAEIRVKTIVD